MLQDQMEFDGAFGAAESGPVEDTGTQFYGRGIDGEQLVLEAQFRALSLNLNGLLTTGEQLREQLLIELQGAMLVGIG
ncbi:MAG: hypothetical protein JWN98_1416 [Abditibacteriota bacterium]|jgi:hypothetical protein|nr:hypothetical protein [Abditibacteriota bacterium]